MPPWALTWTSWGVFEGRGVHPAITNTSVEDAAILSMVEHGLGVSILSELVLQGRRDNVLRLPLDPPACRRIGIAVQSLEEAAPGGGGVHPLLPADRGGSPPVGRARPGVDASCILAGFWDDLVYLYGFECGEQTKTDEWREYAVTGKWDEVSTGDAPAPALSDP